jgi:hypothetical protein
MFIKNSEIQIENIAAIQGWDSIIETHPQLPPGVHEEGLMHVSLFMIHARIEEERVLSPIAEQFRTPADSSVSVDYCHRLAMPVFPQNAADGYRLALGASLQALSPSGPALLSARSGCEIFRIGPRVVQAVLRTSPPEASHY